MSPCPDSDILTGVAESKEVDAARNKNNGRNLGLNIEIKNFRVSPTWIPATMRLLHRAVP